MDSKFDSIILSARRNSDREMQTARNAVFFQTSLELFSTEFTGWVETLN